MGADYNTVVIGPDDREIDPLLLVEAFSALVEGAGLEQAGVPWPARSVAALTGRAPPVPWNGPGLAAASIHNLGRRRRARMVIVRVDLGGERTECTLGTLRDVVADACARGVSSISFEVWSVRLPFREDDDEEDDRPYYVDLTVYWFATAVPAGRKVMPERRAWLDVYRRKNSPRVWRLSGIRELFGPILGEPLKIDDYCDYDPWDSPPKLPLL